MMEAQRNDTYPGEGGQDITEVFTGRINPGPSVGNREKGKSSRKSRGLKMPKKTETLQVFWCGFTGGSMGATSQDEAGGVSDGHISKDPVRQVMEDGQRPESFKETLADFYGPE